jgi:hypothetical protein
MVHVWDIGHIRRLFRGSLSQGGHTIEERRNSKYSRGELLQRCLRYPVLVEIRKDARGVEGGDFEPGVADSLMEIA